MTDRTLTPGTDRNLSSNANDDTWENNAKYLLERCPHTVRVREGGGPENLMHSFIHTFMTMEQKLRSSPETRASARDDDPALWLLRYLNRLGGLGHDKHRLIDAVIEGKAYIEGNCMHIDGPPAQKASEQRHGAAQDFVSFDPQGGVWIDMARYLRSPAGQAQLQALGGKKATVCQCDPSGQGALPCPVHDSESEGSVDG